MAILPSGINSWFQMGSNQPLPKWWRWVMLLILVYSSTISVLTGQARVQAAGPPARPTSCPAARPAVPPALQTLSVCRSRLSHTRPCRPRGAPPPSSRAAPPCVGQATAGRARRRCAASARGSNTCAPLCRLQGFSSISVDAAKYYDTSEVVINTLVTASNVAQIVVVRPCCRSLAWPWGG